MPFRVTTTAESAARFRARYARRLAAARAIEEQFGNAQAFRAAVLDKIGTAIGKHPRELREMMLEDWGGDVPMPRVRRAVAFWASVGEIVRTDSGYIRARRRARAA